MLQKNDAIIKIRGHHPQELIKKYGSPLYIYDEITLRQNCRKIKEISHLPGFSIYYSTKANSSIELLKIIKSEGVKADAMSAGELYLVEKAGYTPQNILFMSNNLSKDDLSQVVNRGLNICLDSIDEVESFFKLSPGKDVSIRINNGISDGHSAKVKTAGKVKFGISPKDIDLAHEIARKSGGGINGFFSHIGSFFLDYDIFHHNVLNLLSLAEKYPKLKYIDFGGGFGIPYYENQQNEFPMKDYQKIFDKTLSDWQNKTGHKVNFSIQPGRFVVATSGICLCRVNSIKENFGRSFVGTDLGFNFFPRPMLYDGHHQILNSSRDSANPPKICDVVGNLCESGDILGKQVELDRETKVGDILLLKDAGAYCFSMSSNYIAMPKPAEILIKEDGTILPIRERETIDDLAKNQLYT